MEHRPRAMCRRWFPLRMMMMMVWSIVHLYSPGPAQALSLPGFTSPYYLIKQSLTWVEALTYCRTQYTDLASIESDTDLYGVSSVALLSEVWVGLYLCSPGLWRWSTGNALATYTKWNSGMPGQTSYSCARLNLGKWNDGSCDLRYYFICYKAATATTATAIPDSCQWPLLSSTAAPINSQTNGSAPNNQFTNGQNGATNQQNGPSGGTNQQTNSVSQPNAGPNQPTAAANQPTNDVSGATGGFGGQANTLSGPTDGLSGQTAGLIAPSAASVSANSVQILTAASDSTVTAVQTTSEVTEASATATASSDSSASITTSWASSQQSSGDTTASSDSSASITTSWASSQQSSGDTTGLLHFVQTPMSWVKSRLYCRSNFTDLAAVQSLQEQDNMAALLSHYRPSAGFWIGLRYNRFRSQWYWSGRQKWGAFSYWGSGEPEDPFNNSCGMISGDPTQNFTWSTECCGQKLPFVCYGGL